MALPENFLETVITAVVSGGGTAVSAILSFFKDVKRRMDTLEKRVGSAEDKTGLVHAVAELEEAVEAIQGWTSHPPEWLLQLVRRGRTSVPTYTQDEYELGDRLRGLERQIKQLEGSVDKLERRVDRTVLDDSFEAVDRQRAIEISEIRTNVAVVHGLVKGLESALGLIGKPPHR